MVMIKFTKKVEADGREYLPDIAKRANMKIPTPCSGKGTCGKCLVKINKGEVSPPTDKEIKKLGQEKLDKGFRLACQISEISSDTTVKLKK